MQVYFCGNNKKLSNRSYYFNEVFYDKDKANFADKEFNPCKLNQSADDYVEFINTEYFVNADFSNSKFNAKNVCFMNAAFNENSKFSNMQANTEEISFMNARFNKDADFSNLKVKTESLDFQNVEFNGQVDFSNSIFDSKKHISFMNTQFKNGVNFSNIKFMNKVILANSKFNAAKTSFEGATFNKGANFEGVNEIDLKEILRGAIYKQGTEDLFELPEGVNFYELGMSSDKSIKKESVDDLLDQLKTATGHKKIEIINKLEQAY